MATKPKESGPSGKRVAANLRELRKARGFDLAGLAARMDELGQPVGLSALSKIENRQRRVDVDDLVALAVALDVSPSRLLLSATADPDAQIDLTPRTTVSERDAWGWAAGSDPLPQESGRVLDLDRVGRFAAENQPHDPPDETSILQMREWGKDGTLDGLRDGYRAALVSGVSHGATRVYLDLLDHMSVIRKFAEERTNGER